MENWFDVLKELTYVKQNGEDTFVYKNHVLDYWETRCELWDLFTKDMKIDETIEDELGGEENFEKWLSSHVNDVYKYLDTLI